MADEPSSATVAGNPSVVPTTSVSTTHVQTTKTYDTFGAIGMVFGGIVGVIIFLNAVSSFFESISNWMKKRRDAERQLDAPLENRVKHIEELSRSFLSKDYLDREFNRLEQMLSHEKANRQMVTDTLTDTLRGITSTISDEQRARARLEAQVESMASNTQRVETAVELLRERIDERFDKFQELLVNRVR